MRMCRDGGGREVGGGVKKGALRACCCVFFSTPTPKRVHRGRGAEGTRRQQPCHAPRPPQMPTSTQPTPRVRVRTSDRPLAGGVGDFGNGVFGT